MNATAARALGGERRTQNHNKPEQQQVVSVNRKKRKETTHVTRKTEGGIGEKDGVAKKSCWQHRKNNM